MVTTTQNYEFIFFLFFFLFFVCFIELCNFFFKVSIVVKKKKKNLINVSSQPFLSEQQRSVKYIHAVVKHLQNCFIMQTETLSI